MSFSSIFKIQCTLRQLSVHFLMSACASLAAPSPPPTTDPIQGQTNISPDEWNSNQWDVPVHWLLKRLILMGLKTIPSFLCFTVLSVAPLIYPSLHPSPLSPPPRTPTPALPQLEVKWWCHNPSSIAHFSLACRLSPSVVSIFPSPFFLSSSSLLDSNTSPSLSPCFLPPHISHPS